MSNLSNIFGAGFDTNAVEPQGDFEVMSPGKVPVIIDKSEVKQTKKQDGHYLELAMTILDGEYRNRKLWDRINIENPSQKCVEIGRRKLSALGRATGVLYIQSEDQFLGKTCTVHLKVKDEQNEIRTYSAMTVEDGTRPAMPTQQHVALPTQPSMPPPVAQPLQQPTAPQGAAVGPIGQPGTAGTPPWER